MFDRGHHSKTLQQPFFAQDSQKPDRSSTFYLGGQQVQLDYGGDASTAWHVQDTHSQHGTWHDAASDSTAWHTDEDSYEHMSDSSDESATESQVDITDVTAYLTVPEAGEQLYLAYRHAKSRWRKFQGATNRHSHRARRFGHHKRRFGKGKGKGKSKGKPYAKAFYEEAPTMHTASASMHDSTSSEGAWWSDPAVIEALAFYKGKGKGGKGSKGGPRLNPMGPDGKRMLCSVCNSDSHFRANCPQGQNSHLAAQTDLSSTRLQPAWMGLTVEDHHNHSNTPTTTTTSTTTTSTTPQVLITEQTVLGVTPVNSRPRMKLQDLLSFVVWNFHAVVKLASAREGLLIDTGAVGNLTGDRWVARVQELCEPYKQGVAWEDMAKPLSINGVGQGGSACNKKIIAPLALADGSRAQFSAPVIPNSDVPALLGNASMSQHRMLIDVMNRKLFMVGHGGYSLQLSPGSRSLDLETSPSGHLLLPVTEWQKQANTTAKEVSFWNDSAEPNNGGEQPL